MNIQLALQFYPNQANPARADGRGVYRVKACIEVPSCVRIAGLVYTHPRARPLLWLFAARPYKVGSRVDPLRVALDYQRAITPLMRAA